MLYVKKIDEITYEAVQDFCRENIKERETLEYKSIITKELDKEISAMANTYGGIIIIGVNDDKDGYPEPPFEGIDYKKGLGDRITQIDISNIYPPVFPEIQVCPENKNKTFIVIRIPQSNSTPHYIMEKTKAYVRTGSINTPQKIADVNELEWLRNKRTKAEKIRETILRNAEEHYSKIGGYGGFVYGQASHFSISSCPLYPSKSLFDYQIIEDILIKDRTKPCIWYEKNIKFLPIQSGLVAHNVRENFYEFLEINQFGLVSKKRALKWRQRERTEEEIEDKIRVTTDRISYENMFVNILSFFEFINFFYEKIGYHGYCKLAISIKKISNVALNPVVARNRILSENRSIVDEYRLPEEFEILSIPKFRNQDYRIQTLINIGKNIAWSFGSEFDVYQKVEKYLIEFALLLLGKKLLSKNILNIKKDSGM